MSTSLQPSNEDRIYQLELMVKQYKERYEKLREDNENLSNELLQGERDTIDVIAFFRRESDRKDELVQQLNDKVTEIIEQNRIKTNQMEASHQQQIKELEDAVEQKDAQLRVAQAELASLKEFKAKRHEIQEELSRTKRELEELQRKHQETTSKMEHKFYEEKVKFQKETNQKMAEIQKLSHEEALQRLDESTKQIIIENRRMAEELRLQVQETDELQRAKKRMEEENERLLRDVELNEQSVKEYAKQGYRRGKEVKDLTNKVKNLERSLGQVVRDLEKERETSAHNIQKLTEQSQAEINALKRLLDLKAKELSGIRKLAQNVLDQRSELERFFLESLEQCKQEITLRRSGGLQRKKDASGFQSQKVDVSELTWEDRERILRLLFSKMSSNSAGKMQNTLRSGSPNQLTSVVTPSHMSAYIPKSAPTSAQLQYADGDTFLTDGAPGMLSDL